MTPALPRATKEQVATRVLERLKDTWSELEDVALETAVKAHLLRLPRRYALDIHNLEDLRTHMTLLQAAQSSAERKGEKRRAAAAASASRVSSSAMRPLTSRAQRASIVNGTGNALAVLCSALLCYSLQ